MIKSGSECSRGFTISTVRDGGKGGGEEMEENLYVYWAPVGGVCCMLGAGTM